MPDPGWATDELAEEWVEPSTSPTHEPSSAARALFGDSIKGRAPAGSLNDKRGSLRSLGHAAPRGMPSFQSPSGGRVNSSTRIVSGHNSRPLLPSGEFIVPSGTGLLSPPSSRSSCEDDGKDLEAGGDTSMAVGTCVVNANAADDRGGALAKGVKGVKKDIFGKNPLERMFDPPSPPTAESSDQGPPTPSPMPPLPMRNPTREAEPRRISHPYAPARPSRLSKSMTPSSNGSTIISEVDQSGVAPEHEDQENTHNYDDQPEDDQYDHSLAPTVPDQEIEDETSFLENIAPPDHTEEMRVFSQDVSPLPHGATRFPFTFKAQVPARVLSGATGSGDTGSGSATVRGTIRDNIFDSMQERPDGPSHSTIHERSPVARTVGLGLGDGMQGRSAAQDRLRLFRSTYDTLTREHLSAIVDSIAIEPSPSPPGARERYVGNMEDQDEDEGDSESDGSRNSKRLRLSPPSPPFEPRDWGKHGLEIIGRIKGRPVESTTSASASPMSRQEEEGPTFDYPSISPTPPLSSQPPPRGKYLQARAGPSQPLPQSHSRAQAQGKHRSNPSTASSGYLRAAEEIMANLRNRTVSDSAVSASASALASSPGTVERRALSETDDNVGSSETDGHEDGAQLDAEVDAEAWKWSLGSKRRVSGVSLRSSPESNHQSAASQSYGSLRRSLPRHPHSQSHSQSHHHNQSQPQRFQQAPQPAFNTEDLNRFVSATTVPTCTTMSTSFVKHAGPRGGERGKGMRMIRPEDVNGLVSGQMGGMRFNPARMAWERDRAGVGSAGDLARVSEGSESRLAGASGNGSGNGSGGRSDESVDPFAGMSEGSGMVRGGEGGTQKSGGSGPSERSWRTTSRSPEKREQEQQSGHASEEYAGSGREAAKGHEKHEHDEYRYEQGQQEDGDENQEEDAHHVANTTTMEVYSDLSDDFAEVADKQHQLGPNQSFNSHDSEQIIESPESVVEPLPTTSEPARTSPSGPPPHPLAHSMRPVPVHANSAPAIMTPLPSHLAPKPVRSALRNPANAVSSETPGMKKTKTTNWALDLTPAPPWESVTRSVSFSDGRRHGQIEGLDTGRMEDEGRDKARPAPTTTPGREMSLNKAGEGQGRGNLFNESGQSLMNSARTRRIQGLLDDMEDLTLNEMTPSKPSRYTLSDPSRPPLKPTATGFQDASLISFADDTINANPVTASAGAVNLNGVASGPMPLPSRSGFRRSRSFRDSDNDHDDTTNHMGKSTAAKGNATFLTECSFAVAQDQLVRVITDVQPFEPYWETLESVDLSGKGLESVARLKDFLPGLDEAKMNDNAISYLTGLPSGIRTLHVAGNRLTALAIVDHLRNLQFLDISRNQLDSVSQLSCLKHLRELRADYNRISTLDGILGLDSLLKVSVRGNRIDTLDLGNAKWTKLETLDIAENGLGDIRSLERLKSAVQINLDDNDLTSLSASTQMICLRSLRVSRNDLSILDLSHFPRIRTLYVDQNRLTRLSRSGSERGRIEALSIRSQRVRGLRLDEGEMRVMKRLYISGNEMTPESVPPMSQLRYLEAAACRFSTLPNLETMPELEVLNANYNFIETLEGLQGGKSLRKVMLVGNRLCGEMGDLVMPVDGLRIEEMDLRMNPSTLGFYLPLFIPPPTSTRPTTSLKPQTHPNKTNVLLGRANATLSASRMGGGAGTSMSIFHQPENEDWEAMDREYRRNLPDTWYGKRLCYRGMMMRGLERLRWLDGVDVGDGERKKAGELLSRAGR